MLGLRFFKLSEEDFKKILSSGVYSRSEESISFGGFSLKECTREEVDFPGSEIYLVLTSPGGSKSYFELPRNLEHDWFEFLKEKAAAYERLMEEQLKEAIERL